MSMATGSRCDRAIILAALAGAATASLTLYSCSRWWKAQARRSQGTVTTPPLTNGHSHDFPEELSDALQVHYGGGEAMRELLTDMGLVFGCEFAADCARICERNCEALQDFTGEKGEATALDLGCSVGGTAFELRQVFPVVVAVDPDAIRIDLAKHVSRGQTWFHCGHMIETGELLPDKLFPDKSDPPMFITAEACTFLDTVRLPFDCVLCAGFLERCGRPAAVLERLPRALKPGGVVVLVFQWFWDAGVYPLQSAECVGEQPSGLDTLVKEAMEKRFDFVEEHMLAMITNKAQGNFSLQLARACIWRLRPKGAAACAAGS